MTIRLVKVREDVVATIKEKGGNHLSLKHTLTHWIWSLPFISYKPLVVVQSLFLCVWILQSTYPRPYSFKYSQCNLYYCNVLTLDCEKVERQMILQLLTHTVTHMWQTADHTEGRRDSSCSSSLQRIYTLIHYLRTFTKFVLDRKWVQNTLMHQLGAKCQRCWQKTNSISR